MDLVAEMKLIEEEVRRMVGALEIERPVTTPHSDSPRSLHGVAAGGAMSWHRR
jgi:hypothetical protein